MRERIAAALIIGVVLASAVRAVAPNSCCKPVCGHCIVPPPPLCPKCTCPCDECRLCLCPPWKVKETHAWIERLLRCSNAQTRKKAACKLGCRWHADFCQTPEVLSALIAALHDDACWEVRRAAATSLREQNARTPPAIRALYIAGRLDPHYLVRERANESIDILLVVQRPCYKQLFKDTDEVIQKLRGKYKPGSHESQTLATLFGGSATTGTSSDGSALPTEAPDLEAIPGPTNRSGEAKGENK